MGVASPRAEPQRKCQFSPTKPNRVYLVTFFLACISSIQERDVDCGHRSEEQLGRKSPSCTLEASQAAEAGGKINNNKKKMLIMDKGAVKFPESKGSRETRL